MAAAAVPEAPTMRGLSRQHSAGSITRSGRVTLCRQTSLDPRGLSRRFTFGRQSSMDPNRRSTVLEELTVPENLDSTMQLLFLACKGDVKGVEDLLKDGVDVNSIDLDGRTALHIAACEGQIEVAKLLLRRKANIDARDRWGSTVETSDWAVFGTHEFSRALFLQPIFIILQIDENGHSENIDLVLTSLHFPDNISYNSWFLREIEKAAADAKYYGHMEVYALLRARGASVPKTRKTPMTVSNPREVPEYELNPGELQFRRGEGIAKGVYQVAKWNGTKVAVKILDKECYADPESINAFKHELTLLEKVRHPNVVQFVGAATQNMPLMIVSEYHPRGDLQSYLQKKGRVQAQKALRFALDIARGMNYLHECKPEPIIHCDLKPKNILLDSGGQLKVAGFGSIQMTQVSPDKAKLAHPAAMLDSPSPYMAPEVYKNEVFDRSIDAFSFGFILFEMIEGAPAFHPKSPEDAADMICSEGMRPPFKCKSKSYPPDLKELIEECWDLEPVVRPTFSEIIVRLDKVYATCAKQQRWKDNFKLPWK